MRWTRETGQGIVQAAVKVWCVLRMREELDVKRTDDAVAPVLRTTC